MKFAHLADCHIGGWRDPKLSCLPEKAFGIAIDRCIERKVDFVLIAGDLFNTSIPGIDKIKFVTAKLKVLKDNGISCYIVAGSHDFSPSGKTMLDVLEEAGLCVNVVKGSVEDSRLKLRFSVDSKTGVKLTGMLGLRNMLERQHYDNLIHEHLEAEDGFKIFLFHTALTELKPKHMEKMESNPISLLPKGFDYYAGGHVHIVEKKDLPGYKNVVYPGPLFPNSFSELMDLSSGGFYIYNDGELIRESIILHPVVSIFADCDKKSSEQVENEIYDAIADKVNSSSSLEDSIVLIKLKGVLESGKISAIDFAGIFSKLYDQGSYFVMKNTSGLKTKEFEQIKVNVGSTQDIERDLIDEHIGQAGGDSVENKRLTVGLMETLIKDKNEGERVIDYDERVKEEGLGLLNVS